MAETKKPIQFEDGELTEFASSTFLSIIEAAGSIAVGNPYGVAISAAHILKNARGFIKLKSLSAEIFMMRKNNVLSDQSIKSEMAQDNLIELLDALEKERLTEDKFEILRKVFLQGLVNIEAKKDEILSREFLVQARKLDPSEIIVLSSIWSQGNPIQSHAKDESEFLSKVETRAKLPPEICRIYIEKLSEKAFLRMFTNNMGWNCELTTFGRQFCYFITEFDRMEKSYFAKS